jgi:uncharacterized membrane protein
MPYATLWRVITIPQAKMVLDRKTNSLNHIIIYILSFKVMAIMENYYLFIHMNVKKIKLKIHWLEF